MKHLGNITKIHNAPFVDCITFGSPCQDLSIAGKRAGLNGERSGLFMEAVRIIKEMRGISNGVYPTFAVWENVTGAFSSNRGEDFRVVLEELANIIDPKVSIARPENGKWAKAWIVCGDGWSIAWRTLDAQFWGVPQRRKRVCLVLDIRGHRAGEVLFERKSLSGNLDQGIPAWKGIARNHSDSVDGYDRVVVGTDLYNGAVTGDIAASITTATGLGAANTGPTILCENPFFFESNRKYARYTNSNAKISHLVLRRPTPTECERLQGFPDGWTDIGDWIDYHGKSHKSLDSYRYKALGNSIALPQWWWLTCKMSKFLPEHATLGSLFDGIGGFPLVWETRYGKGTAVWASEIEEFPIAVTKLRFGEE